MPRLSLGLGVQGTRKVGGGSAPSGLPVASTPSIVVVGSGGVPSATYNKKEEEDVVAVFDQGNFLAGLPPFYSKTQVEANAPLYFFLGPNASLLDFDALNYYVNGSNWKIFSLSDNEGVTLGEIGTNPSTNADYIPTSGWSPSITITAA